MTYIDDSKSIKHCPAPNCDVAIEDDSFVSKFFSCTCGETFCAKCNHGNH